MFVELDDMELVIFVLGAVVCERRIEKGSNCGDSATVADKTTATSLRAHARFSEWPQATGHDTEQLRSDQMT